MGRELKPCGTDASYARGCRCAECKAAHSLACRQWRQKSGYKAAPPRTMSRKYADRLASYLVAKENRGRTDSLHGI